MKVRIFIFAVAAMLALQSCDWVKRQLGMPTSADLEQKRVELLLKAEQQRIADSLNALRLDSIAKAESAKMPYLQKLDNRFYLILGSFKKDFNADIMYNNLKKQGFAPVRISLKNGFDMVSAYATDSYGEALARMEKIIDNDLCPYDVWIYDATQNLHE